MLPWITSNDTSQIFVKGVEATARSTLLLPEYYETMLANYNTDIYCTRDLGDYGDGMCERDEDTLELMCRKFEWKIFVLVYDYKYRFEHRLISLTVLSDRSKVLEVLILRLRDILLPRPIIVT